MKKNLPDVSIIVPIHNSEKYLERCLDSVCGQTYKNIEIICVDGGSKDNSPSILKRYKEKDLRIKIINDSNTSYGHKINIGFQSAKGEYVGILESDDKYCIDMVGNLYSIAQKYPLDVVGGNIRQIFDYRGVETGYEVQTYKDDSYYNRLIVKQEEPIIYAHGAIFASLYRKSFLMEKEIKVNETPGAAFQDQGFSFLTDILAETAYYIKKPVYEYRIDNIGSSVHDDKKIFEITWEMSFIERELKDRKIINKDIWNEFWHLKYLSYIDKMQSLSQFGRDQFKREFRCDLERDIQYGILEKNIFNKEQTAILQGFREDNDFFEKRIPYKDSMVVKKIQALLDCVLNKPVVIFGAGKQGIYFFNTVKKICDSLPGAHTEIKCFCDNSAELYGRDIEGKIIISVDQAVNDFPEAVFVIANAKHYKEMMNQLKKYNIDESRICFLW